MFGIDDVALAMIASTVVNAGMQGFSSAQSVKGQKGINDLEYQMFHEQMDFQERMYKNRHTYEVEDLKNAGLNPILSANSAASAPMGAAPVQLSNPYKDLPSNLQGIMGGLVQGMNSAKAAKDLKLQDLQGDLLAAQAQKTRVDAILGLAESSKANSDAWFYKSGYYKYILKPLKETFDVANGAASLFSLGPKNINIESGDPRTGKRGRYVKGGIVTGKQTSSTISNIKRLF